MNNRDVGRVALAIAGAIAIFFTAKLLVMLIAT